MQVNVLHSLTIIIFTTNRQTKQQTILSALA